MYYSVILNDYIVNYFLNISNTTIVTIDGIITDFVLMKAYVKNCGLTVKVVLISF